MKDLKDIVKTGMVEGRFKIELFDHTQNKVIQSFEETNMIMNPVAELYSHMASHTEDVYSPPLQITDFNIIAFALGTDGLNADETPKDIDPTWTQLNSERRFWTEGPSHNDGDMKKYVYQVTFEQDSHDGTEHDCLVQNEGGTFPVDASGQPLYYREVISGVDSVKMLASSTYSNNIITFKFHLGQFAGNGCPDWTLAPTFSEAALYMRRGATTSGDSLGTIFSMKTFPKMPKTDSCSIKVEWILDFNVVSVPD